MRWIIRCRSLFNGIAEISLIAEGLISILYLAKLLQIFQNCIKRQVRLECTLLEGSQILSIFR